MRTNTPTATGLPSRIRARSMVAALAVAAVGAAAAYGITASGVDFTRQQDQHQAGSMHSGGSQLCCSPTAPSGT